MTFSNPSRARGSRVNLSGKQKSPHSNNDVRDEIAAAKAALPAALPAGVPPAPNGLPPLMALPQTAPPIAAKRGARIPLPTQNAILRGRAKEEAVETPSVEEREQKAGTEPKMKAGGRWIQGMGMKKGALHREMGVPEGTPIPAGKLATAASKPGKLGKRARLAQTLKGFK